MTADGVGSGAVLGLTSAATQDVQALATRPARSANTRRACPAGPLTGCEPAGTAVGGTGFIRVSSARSCSSPARIEVYWASAAGSSPCRAPGDVVSATTAFCR